MTLRGYENMLSFWELGQRMTGKRIILSGRIRKFSLPATFSVASMLWKIKKIILLFFFVLFFFWKLGQWMTGKIIVLSGSIINFLCLLVCQWPRWLQTFKHFNALNCPDWLDLTTKKCCFISLHNCFVFLRTGPKNDKQKNCFIR